jgi:hypothetical protein
MLWRAAVQVRGFNAPNAPSIVALKAYFWCAFGAVIRTKNEVKKVGISDPIPL